jgi:UDP:flavonoid glycosyltransferase YjiC (YdhE family)
MRCQLRVLVTSTPGTGHLHAILPLATALRDAGHVVLWAVQESAIERVKGYGFETVPAGMAVAERQAVLAPRLPAIMQLDARERRGHFFTGFFGPAAEVMRTDLGAVFDGFAPDVVVHEVAELAAAPMATARGIPSVTVAFSGPLPEAAISMLLERISLLWRAEGLGAPTMADVVGDLYLHPFPPSFGPVLAVPVLERMRPESPTPAVDRRAIYLTAGTEVASAQGPWAAMLDALGALDVDVLATVGSHLDIDDLGPMPGNIRVERFFPQHLVLDRVAVVCSHGGAGSTLGAAAIGVPQLVNPLVADQWETADAIAGAGAGIVVEVNQRNPEFLATAVQRLLKEPGFSDAASRVAEEMGAMPSAQDIVPIVEALAS